MCTTQEQEDLEMNKHFHVKSEERKKLVKIIAEVLGEKAKYLGMPTAAYQIGEYMVSKDGELSSSDEHPMQNKMVLDACKEAGFQTEEETEMVQQENPENGAEDKIEKLIVELPKEKFTDKQLENLQKLIHGKEALLKQALAIDELSVKITEEKIIFPWFSKVASAEEVTAYTQLIAFLGEMARTAERVTLKEKEVENPKYTFRCFLLRLGFIGPEYKQSRKVLLKNLTGSSAFKSGAKKEGGEQ